MGTDSMRSDKRFALPSLPYFRREPCSLVVLLLLTILFSGSSCSLAKNVVSRLGAVESKDRGSEQGSFETELLNQSSEEKPEDGVADPGVAISSGAGDTKTAGVSLSDSDSRIAPRLTVVPSTPVRVDATSPQIVEQAAPRAVEQDPLMTGVVGSDEGGSPPLLSPDVQGHEIFRYSIHAGPVNALVLSQDGRTVFSGGDDGKVFICTLHDRVFGEHSNKGSGASAGRSPFVQRDQLLESDRPILALALSSNERYLAVSQFSHVLVVDLSTRQVAFELSRVKGRIVALEWDPLGELLALGLASGDVFVWRISKGSAAGEDSLEAVEEYPGGVSAVTRIVFHPAGRSFFVAEKEGKINLWRLLRTEEKMGLRDRFAAEDREQEGSERLHVADLPTRIEDLWIDQGGAMLFAAAGDGNVYRWKVRGLVLDGSFQAGKGAVVGMTGLNVAVPASKKKRGAQTDGSIAEMLVTVSRDQRIKWWCRSFGAESSLSSDGIDKIEGLGSVLQTELLTDSPTTVRTARLLESVSGLNSVPSLLWAAEKTGNLLAFDPRLLFRSLQRKKRVMACLGGG